MIKFKRITFALILLLFTVASTYANNDFDTFKENYRASQQSVLELSASQIKALQKSYTAQVFDLQTGVPVNALKKDDYNAHSAYWKHVYNLSSLYAYAEHYPQSADKLKSTTAKPEILDLIVKTVNWYFDNNKQCTHEYHKTYSYHAAPIIGLMDFTLATLYNHIHNNPSPELKRATDAMLAYGDYQLDSGNQTKGPNWTFRVIKHCFRHAYVSNDPARLDRLRKAIARGLTYTLIEETGESDGFYPDGMVFHHGEMCYFSMYGKEMVDKHIEMHHFIQNTKWQFTQEEWNTIAFLYWEGVRYAIYRGNPEYTTAPKRASELPERIEWASRQAADDVQKVMKYSGGTKYDALFTEWIKNYDSIPESHAADAKLVERDEHKYFWNGDYQIHRRNAYYIAVRRSSLRARAPEDAGTKVGHMHLHYGSGYTPILVRGDEYRVARIGWNWLALPGTTNEMCGTVASGKAASRKRNNTTFSGGVSDGKYGVGAFVYKPYEWKEDKIIPINGATAQKSNFFFDEGMLCLGTDIRRQGIIDDNEADIVTTLDQKRSETDMYYSIDGAAERKMTKTETATINETVKKNAWFWHSNVAYIVFAQKKNPLQIQASVDLRELNEVLRKEESGWKNVYQPGLTSDEQEMEKIWMWQLGINHGQNPEGDQYIYMVLPNVSKKQAAAYCKNPRFEIESMTTQQHIVRHLDANMYQGVCFQGGDVKLRKGGKISVEVPVIFQLRKNEQNETVLTVQNPNARCAQPRLVPDELATDGFVGIKYENPIAISYKKLKGFTDYSTKIQFDNRRNYEGKAIVEIVK